MKHPINIAIISLLLISILSNGCKKECDGQQAFTVKAGKDQNILTGTDSVVLIGSVNKVTPSIIYSWSVISGPDTPAINNNTSTKAYVKNLNRGTYTFQFQASDNTGNIGFDTTTVIVDTGVTNTITIQPGGTTSQDAEVVNVPGEYTGNELWGPDAADSSLRISDWTYYAQGYGEGNTRSFIKFKALDTLPAGSLILSATLSLTGINSGYPGWIGNSIYPGSPYDIYDSNNVWIQRVTANWNQATINYNNQPAVTTADEVAIPSSMSQYGYDITNLDVTQLIKDMTATSGTNYGFCMRLQNETIYRQMGFYRANTSDSAANSPKLVITYKYF
jgi:hypothetical protein